MVVIPDAPQAPRTPGQPAFFSAGNGVVAPQDLTGRQLTGLGDAAVRAGTNLSRYAEQEQEKINRSRARELTAGASEGDIAGWVDYRSKTGKEAVDGGAGALEAYDKRSQEWAEKADNPEQSEAILMARTGGRPSYFAQVAGHQARQLDVMDRAAAGASLEQGKNELVAFYGETPHDQGPQGKQQAEAHQERLAKTRMDAAQMALKMPDYTPAGAELFVLGHMSEAHTNMVDSLLVQGRVGEASQYLADNKGEFVPAAFTKAQGEVNTKVAAVAREQARKSLVDDSLRLSSAVIQQAVADFRGPRGGAEGFDVSLTPGQQEEFRVSDDAMREIDAPPDPVLLEAAARRTLRQMFDNRQITGEQYQKTIEQVGKDIKAYSEVNAHEAVTAMRDTMAWLDEDPTRAVEEAPDYDIITKHGKLDEIKTYARNHRVVDDPVKLLAQSLWTEAEWADLTPAKYAEWAFGRLEQGTIDKGLARIAKANKAADANQLRLVEIDDINIRFAREWSVLGPERAVGEKESPRFKAMLEKIQALAKSLNLEKDMDPLEYRDVVLKEANRLMVEVPDPDAWFGGTIQRPTFSLSAEQEEVAVIHTAGGEAVKPSDLTPDIRAYLIDEMRRTDEMLLPGQMPDMTMLANAWVEDGRKRPFLGVPGQMVEIDGKEIRKEDALLSEAEGLRKVKEIPTPVWQALSDSLGQLPDLPVSDWLESSKRALRSERAFPVIDHVEGMKRRLTGPRVVLRPDEIWNEWHRLGRPMTVDAMQAVR